MMSYKNTGIPDAVFEEAPVSVQQEQSFYSVKSVMVPKELCTQIHRKLPAASLGKLHLHNDVQ